MEDVPGLEDEILDLQIGPEHRERLRAISWEEIGPCVWLPRWEETVQQYAAALHELTVGRLPLALRSWHPLMTQLENGAEQPPSPEDKEAEIEYILFCALAVALVRDGWVLETGPGAPIILRRGDRTILPRQVIEDLMSGDLSTDVWR